MKNLFKILGANQKEADIIRKLLELGPQPISVVAKHMEMPRSSTYVVLDSLMKLGLVEKFERGGIQFVKAISAVEIEDLLKSKERYFGNALSMLKEKLPEFERFENRLSVTPKVHFFEGKQAVMKMYEEVLKEKEFCAIFNPTRVKKSMPEYHYKIPETLKKNGGKAREILVDCEEAIEYKNKYDSIAHKIKIFPKNVNFASDTIICADKIYMISYGENDISATKIINYSLADTQKQMFEIAWSGL